MVNKVWELWNCIKSCTELYKRFCSFEIFKEFNSKTQALGPSFGMKEKMLPLMIKYLLDHHYVDINKLSNEIKFTKLIETIKKRTAIMVASWQAYGFCHGVLNTDEYFRTYD